MSMSPLPDAPVTAPTPALVAASRLQKMNAAILLALVDDYRAVSARLWRDPNIAAQEIFAEFGNEGAALLSTLQARQDCIEAFAVANGEALSDYLTTAELTAPVYLESSGVITQPDLNL